MEKVRGDGKSKEGWKKHVEAIDESTMLGDGIKEASC